MFVHGSSPRRHLTDEPGSPNRGASASLRLLRRHPLGEKRRGIGVKIRVVELEVLEVPDDQMAVGAIAHRGDVALDQLKIGPQGKRELVVAGERSPRPAADAHLAFEKRL